MPINERKKYSRAKLFEVEQDNCSMIKVPLTESVHNKRYRERVNQDQAKKKRKLNIIQVQVLKMCLKLLSTTPRKMINQKFLMN